MTPDAGNDAPHDCRDGCEGKRPEQDRWNATTGHWYCPNGNDNCARHAGNDVARQAAREALMDAADYLLPGDKAGPDFLIYLAVTKYGRGEYDPATVASLIERRVIPPGAGE